jgi:hypothetical protein
VTNDYSLRLAFRGLARPRHPNKKATVSANSTVQVPRPISRINQLLCRMAINPSPVAMCQGR